MHLFGPASPTWHQVFYRILAKYASKIGQAHHVPIGRARERKPVDTDMQRDMRRYEEILEAMERRKHSDNLDDSDEEAESFDEEEEDPEEVKVLKMLLKASSRTRVEVPMYEANLNVEELMDWINALNKYFDFE